MSFLQAMPRLPMPEPLGRKWRWRIETLGYALPGPCSIRFGSCRLGLSHMVDRLKPLAPCFGIARSEPGNMDCTTVSCHVLCCMADSSPFGQEPRGWPCLWSKRASEKVNGLINILFLVTVTDYRLIAMKGDINRRGSSLSGSFEI